MDGLQGLNRAELGCSGSPAAVMKFEMSLQPLTLNERMLCQRAEWPDVCIRVFFSFCDALKIVLGALCNFSESQPRVSERTHTDTHKTPTFLCSLWTCSVVIPVGTASESVGPGADVYCIQALILPVSF